MEELDDGSLLVMGEPVVAGDRGVVLVDLAVPLLPVVILTLLNAAPRDDELDRQLGPLGQVGDEVNDRVSGVMGNPLAI